MERRYNLAVYIYESADLRGTWVAHCLRLDLVSQGSSPAEARDAIEEAVNMVLLDDLNEGLDPMERRPAPDECWAPYRELMETGRPVALTPDVVAREHVQRFVVHLSFEFEQHSVESVDSGLSPIGLNDAAA